MKESPVVGAPEKASLSCVRKPSLEATPNEFDEADPRWEKLDPIDAMETAEPEEGVGRLMLWLLPFMRVLGGVGTSGGSCFVTEKERMVSTPPL